jgi:hypothetical protein
MGCPRIVAAFCWMTGPTMSETLPSVPVATAMGWRKNSEGVPVVGMEKRLLNMLMYLELMVPDLQASLTKSMS